MTKDSKMEIDMHRRKGIRLRLSLNLGYTFRWACPILSGDGGAQMVRFSLAVLGAGAGWNRLLFTFDLRGYDCWAFSPPKNFVSATLLFGSSSRSDFWFWRVWQSAALPYSIQRGWR